MSIKDVISKVVPTAIGAGVTAATGNPFAGYASKSALSSIGGFFNSAMSSVAPAIGAYMSSQQAQEMAERQMQFQEYMSNTAHQREVADLIAAGINPIYTATGGHGASTPNGALADVPDYASVANQGLSYRLQKEMQKAQIEQMHYQNNLSASALNKSALEQDLIQKQIDNYETELQARIKLMASQAYAAIESGRASGANASFTDSQNIGREIENYLRGLIKTYGDNHPRVRDFGMFLEMSGLDKILPSLVNTTGNVVGKAVSPSPVYNFH